MHKSRGNKLKCFTWLFATLFFPIKAITQKKHLSRQDIKQFELCTHHAIALYTLFQMILIQSYDLWQYHLQESPSHHWNLFFVSVQNKFRNCKHYKPKY